MSRGDFFTSFRFFSIVLLLLAVVSCVSPSQKFGSPVPELDINEPTRLIQEADQGNAAEVKKLLAAGEKPDQANPQGVTALMVAARKGYVNVMQLLLSRNASTSLTDDQGSTALHYAVLGNQIEATELLISNHAPLDLKDGFDLTPLMLATRFGDLRIVKTLLKGNANPNIKDENGWSPIFFAIARSDLDIFDALIDRNDDLQAQDTEGDGLVATAVQLRQHFILKKLLEMHAPAGMLDKRKASPLFMAIENGDVESVRMLAKVVSINDKFSDGRTPLMTAIDLRQKNVASLLLSLKPDLTSKDGHGRSYLDHLSALGLDEEWLK
jgi:ankyrin repeat protein